jgi:hypothetical protein
VIQPPVCGEWPSRSGEHECGRARHVPALRHQRRRSRRSLTPAARTPTIAAVPPAHRAHFAPARARHAAPDGRRRAGIGLRTKSIDSLNRSRLSRSLEALDAKRVFREPAAHEHVFGHRIRCRECITRTSRTRNRRFREVGCRLELRVDGASIVTSAIQSVSRMQEEHGGFHTMQYTVAA